METYNKNETRPGFHQSFGKHRFEGDEIKIVNRLAQEWYVTNSGDEIEVATSRYSYFLMKPVTLYSEMFNIKRELIVVFSSYDKFEPRTLDAFDGAQRQLQDLRYETVCRVLISKDKQIEETIETLLKTDPEQPIVIPFTYEELLNPYDAFFIRNRFRKHFYSRDLFSFLSPLKKDLYFFGRNELIQGIINKHKSNEHTGLFGLRKCGKTSIIYAIERALTVNNGVYVSIDCESPSIHKYRWFELLGILVRKYWATIDSKAKLDYTLYSDEKLAADQFHSDIKKIYNSKKHVSFMFIFDEIERISPETGSSPHWRDGDDFIYFWQTLRGFYQRNQEIYTYMLVGTNPSCVESAEIHKHENPLFCSVPPIYVPPFTVMQVREMVRKLGRYMGIQFDELIYSKLADDFGGHPFLIRQMCSYMHSCLKGDRPSKIDKAFYEKSKIDFRKQAVEYYDMILHVLKDWYVDEYDMIKMLASGDEDSFNKFAYNDQIYTKHLVGYGLLNHSSNGYSFSIESIKDYLRLSYAYERENMTEEEMLSEISSRRNKIEKGMRIFVKMVLKTVYGKNKALAVVQKSLTEDRRVRIPNDIDALLDKDASPLYFLDLVQLIRIEWPSFEKIFEMPKDKALYILNEINSNGRPDAHAKGILKEEFVELRGQFKKIEKILISNDFMGS